MIQGIYPRATGEERRAKVRGDGTNFILYFVMDVGCSSQYLFYHVVISLCFMHSRVKNRFVLGLKIKEENIRAQNMAIAFMCSCSAKAANNRNEAMRHWVKSAIIIIVALYRKGEGLLHACISSI